MCDWWIPLCCMTLAAHVPTAKALTAHLLVQHVTFPFSAESSSGPSPMDQQPGGPGGPPNWHPPYGSGGFDGGFDDQTVPLLAGQDDDYLDPNIAWNHPTGGSSFPGQFDAGGQPAASSYYSGMAVSQPSSHQQGTWPAQYTNFSLQPTAPPPASYESYPQQQHPHQQHPHQQHPQQQHPQQQHQQQQLSSGVQATNNASVWNSAPQGQSAQPYAAYPQPPPVRQGPEATAGHQFSYDWPPPPQPALAPRVADSQPVLAPRVTDSQPVLAPRAADSQPTLAPRAADSQPVLAPRVADSQPALAPRVADSQPVLAPRVADSQPVPATRAKKSKPVSKVAPAPPLRAEQPAVSVAPAPLRAEQPAVSVAPAPLRRAEQPASSAAPAPLRRAEQLCSRRLLLPSHLPPLLNRQALLLLGWPPRQLPPGRGPRLPSRQPPRMHRELGQFPRPLLPNQPRHERPSRRSTRS